MRAPLVVLLAVIASARPATIAQDAPAGAVDRWLALGAFPMVETDTRLIHDYLAGLGGEAEVEPDVGSAGQGLTWSPVVPDSAGFLRFARVLMSGRRGNSFSYAHSYLFVPRTGDYLLRVESANDVVAYVNGRRALLRAVTLPQQLRTDTIEARLGEGWNRLLVKLGNRTGPYLLRVTLSDRQGHAIPDLRASASRPANLPHSYPPFEAKLVLSSGAHWRIDNDARLWQPVHLTGALSEGRGHALQLADLSIDPHTLDDDRASFRVPVEALLRAAARDGVAEGRLGQLAVRWSAADLLSRLERPILLDPARPGTDPNRQRVPDLLATFELDYGEETPPSRIRLLNPGYPDVREALRWAAYYSGDTLRYRWNEEDDRALARALLGDDRSGYFQRVAEVERRVADLTRRLKRDTLWLLGHAHIDAAWLWPRSESRAVARNTLRTALALGERFPEYRFLQNSPAYLQWIERDDPRLFEEIQRAVEAGRWTIAGGGWVEMDLNLPSGESLVRHQLHAQRYFQTRFGRRAELAWLLDVFGHSWSFPQILRRSGYERLVIHKVRWNDRNEFPHTAFLWEGVEGSRIQTYVAYLYDHNMNGEWLARDYLEHRAATGASDQMILFGVSDHGGGPTREMLERARTLQRVGPFPALAHELPEVTLGKIFSELGGTSEGRPSGRSKREAEMPAESGATPPGSSNRATLPVWRGELYVENHRGAYTSQARMKRWNRRLESQLEIAEKLATLAWTRGLSYPTAELDSAWQVLLFNQFHDIIAGSSIASVYAEAERDFEAADSLTTSVSRWSLARVASELDTRGDGQPLVVFNPLSWDRAGLVELPLASAISSERLVVQNATGRSLPSTVSGDSLKFITDHVPSLGFAVFWVTSLPDSSVRITAGHDPESPLWQLENEVLSARINPRTGNLTSLLDKRSNREVIQDGHEANRLVVLRDSVPFWEAWNLGWTGESWDVDSVTDLERVQEPGAAHPGSGRPLRQGLRVTRHWGASRFEQTYWLYPGIPGLFVETDVDWREDRKMLKAAFPLRTLTDTLWAEIPYAAIGRPVIPVSPVDSARYEAPMRRWVDASDGKAGVTIANDAHHGYDIREGELRISLLRAPRWPDPDADRGRHRFRYALFPHEGDWSAGRAWQRGAELNVPLVARWEEPHEGTLGARVAFIGSSHPGAVVTALKKAEAENAVVVRVVELAGRPGASRLAWHGPLTSAWTANLLEDHETQIVAEEEDRFTRSLRFELSPFEIRTLVLPVQGLTPQRGSRRGSSGQPRPAPRRP